MRRLLEKGPHALLALVALAGCGGSSPTAAGNMVGNEVQASPTIAFLPPSISIAVGEKVTWVFGSVGHTVTFDPVIGVPANIDGPSSNTSISRSFPTAGVYTYHCSIHPSMTGSVLVGQSNVVPPPPPPPPPPPGYSRTTGG
jgi:plastocyanin